MATITTFTDGVPLQLEPGDVFNVDMDKFAAGTSAYKWARRAGTLPDGVDLPYRTRYLRGTVLESAAGASSGARFARVNTSGSEVSPTPWLQWEVAAAGPIVIPVPVPVRTDTGYTLPAAEGVTWMVDGAVKAPGTYTVTATTEVVTRTIVPSPDAGYEFDAEPEPVTFSYNPPPPPEPEVPPMDATLPTTTIPLGVRADITLTPLFGERDDAFMIGGDLPPGISASPSKLRADTLAGTPSELGSWPLTLTGRDDGGDNTGTEHTLTVVVADPNAPTVIPAPAAERTEDGYMLPEVEGVRWLVDGVETAAGSYSVQPVTESTTVTITPEPLDGYTFDPPAVDLVLTFTPAPAPDPDPEPDPEPDPDPEQPAPEQPGPFDPTPAPDEPDEDEAAAWARLMDDDPQAVYVTTRLAERIIRHAGHDVAELEPSEVLTARDHAATVLEYVRGYTRERGFVGFIPHRALQAVIVSAGARLYVNPEQLTYYSTGDYSERPATLTGWTAAELGVLRRFRRTYR